MQDYPQQDTYTKLSANICKHTTELKFFMHNVYRVCGAFKKWLPHAWFQMHEIMFPLFSLRQFSLHCTKYLLNLGIGIWKTNSPPSLHPSQREHISSTHSDLTIWGVMRPLGLFCGEAKFSIPSPWGCPGDAPGHSDQHPDGVQLQWPLPSWTLGWERRQSFSVEKGEVYWTYVMIIVGFPDGWTVKNPPARQEPQKMQVQSLGQEDPLERGMATHFSILAWRIPGTEEPGGLQSMGSQRAGHNWSGRAQRAASRGVNRLVKTHQRQTETPESESPTYSQDLHSECESQ